MTAQEIVAQLAAGNSVIIPTSYAFEFMREVERHGIDCPVVMMRFGECVTLTADCHEFQSMHGTDACWYCDSDYGQHPKPAGGKQ